VSCAGSRGMCTHDVSRSDLVHPLPIPFFESGPYAGIEQSKAKKKSVGRWANTCSETSRHKHERVTTKVSYSSRTMGQEQERKPHLPPMHCYAADGNAAALLKVMAEGVNVNEPHGRVRASKMHKTKVNNNRLSVPPRRVVFGAAALHFTLSSSSSHHPYPPLLSLSSSSFLSRHTTDEVHALAPSVR
jgi:hypothetical protein